MSSFLVPSIGGFFSESIEPISRIRAHFKSLATKMVETEEFEPEHALQEISDDHFIVAVLGFEFEFKLFLRHENHQWSGVVTVGIKESACTEFSGQEDMSFIIRRDGLTNQQDSVGNLQSISSKNFARWLLTSIFYKYVTRK